MNLKEKMRSQIDQLSKAGGAAGFKVDTFGQVEDYPLIGMTRMARNPDSSEQHIYLSAGIHGDEPAGPQALLELLEENAFPKKHSYTICPLLNPVGLIQGTRENGQEIDLNRDYRHFKSEEIAAHAKWIEQKVQRITHALHLHEDWESQGFYLYELNFSNEPGFSERIIKATRQHIPTETAEEIDGRQARHGIIRPEHVPELEEGDPEAIFLYKRYGCLNYTVETPSSKDFQLRVKALKAATLALL